MYKKFLKLFGEYTNARKHISERFANALTPEAKQLIAAEDFAIADKLVAAVDALADSDDPAVAELKKMVEDLKTAMAENQAEFENKLAGFAEKQTPKQFINFVKQAVEAKVFENAKGNTSIGKTHYENALNNASMNVIYSDTEVGVKPSLVPTLIDFVRQISLSGQNAVAWNELESAGDAAAIVLIGNDKPVKTFTHSTTTTGTTTIAVISKLPKQYRAAISMIADLYLNDMTKDIMRVLNTAVLTLVAAGSDIHDLMTVPTVSTPQIIDAIRAVASGIKNLFPENRVVIGLSQAALFALDSVKDANGNYITFDFAAKGIVLVSVPVAGAFTATSIIGMSESVLRWYNDGIDNLISEERYWDTNNIGLMVEVLNSLFVLRGCDALATCFDDYSTIIQDMTAAPVAG